MTTEAINLFEDNRQLLFSIAYRMLGTVMDAQDMIQETFLRWQQTTPGAIRSPRAWLTTVITRLCLNHLNSARVQREEYVGPWLPEPLVSGPDGDPREHAHLKDSLSFAFLVMLENLAPIERAVFVLREVFSHDFSDIAATVEKSEVNCRQILARARKRIDARRPQIDTAPEQAEHLVQQFQDAVLTGDLQGLLNLLAKDVTLVADGGGKARAVLRPIRDADRVAPFFIALAQRFGSDGQSLQPATVNGLPGIVNFEDDRLVRVLAFEVHHQRIRSIYIVANPDKLRRLRTDAAAHDLLHSLA